MEFTCGDSIDSLNCTSLTSSICPSQDIDSIGNVDLMAFNVDRENEYAGCYSPCGVLTYSNWGNQYGTHSPDAYPADEYCCAGAYQQPDQCKTGPDGNMAYTQVVHANCDAYAWAYDDAVGLKACPSAQTKFLVQFYDP